jgi:hypothetical protein
MLFWTLLAAGQIAMPKVDGWQIPTRNTLTSQLTWLPNPVSSAYRRLRHQIPTQIATAPTADKARQ